MLTGDIGRLATLAHDDRLAEAELAVFHPLKFMLASPAEDAAEIVRRLGDEVWVEDKYDGIRAQLHKLGDRTCACTAATSTMSARSSRRSSRRPGSLPWDGVLDGEVLGFKDGLSCPSSACRRGSAGSAQAAVLADIPVIYVAFDALASVAGEDERGARTMEPLLRVPLRERRAQLDELDLPTRRALRSPPPGRGPLRGRARAAFSDARARRNEGLMVKDPDSGYSPGRRGLGWLKMKKALATIDCVVVGVEVGHGKRHGVLSDYTFAVRDEASGELVNIGKAYSGLTDAEIAEMTQWFEAHTIARYGRYRQVEPTVVVEIAFDVIVRSSTPRVRVQPALPAHPRPASGQVARRDRHGRDGDRAVRGTAARGRAVGDRWRARNGAT